MAEEGKSGGSGCGWYILVIVAIAISLSHCGSSYGGDDYCNTVGHLEESC